jgi:hypothetical protein
MLRISKTVLGAMLAAAAIQQAGAFSMWGPAESWQTTELDYLTGHFFWYGDVELGGTKNFGEGSRLNVPVLTYSFDATFLDYFGQQGVQAVENAMAVFNALPAASSASANLTEFITQGNQQINYTAQAMGMIDIKSAVMGLIIEHMGLIGETHVFDLNERVAEPGACQFSYAVLTRNFDPITYDPTTYVNGQNYSYYIGDACLVGVQNGDAFELPADATTGPFNFTAVATKESLDYGGFYLGLTRDDFGGLRYLYRRNNYNYEALDPEAAVNVGGTGGGGSPFAPYEGTTATNTLTGIVAPTAFDGVLGGVEKIQYVKVAYDSQVGAFFAPLFYTYTIPYVTNSRLTSLTVTRTITAPDILFTAADLVAPAPPVFVDTLYTRGPGTFIANNEPASQGGGVLPGVMNPTLVVTLNKAGTVYYNFNPAYLDLGTRIQLFSWGSFDGTTNAPIVYPTGSSLSLLEEQVLSGGTSAPSGAFNPATVVTNAVTNAPTPLQY